MHSRSPVIPETGDTVTEFCADDTSNAPDGETIAIMMLTPVPRQTD